MISAIPTKYKDVQFRSRLEARWAAFFDLCGLPWLYEPLDLNGYIPDFIIPLKKTPQIIEVKPALVVMDMHEAVPKIVASGWKWEFAVVGVSPFMDCGRSYNRGDLGIHSDKTFSPEPGSVPDADGFLCIGICESCGVTSLADSLQSFHCRNCGVNDGGLRSIDRWPEFWATAGNVVQWKRPLTGAGR